ncbi:MAG TPA: lipid-binding SYLF domain-containing protein [Steroidobacteraceae bacterium]|nr:lipid-binding SYLF domain-containing protein [Steroidobacteraceae bacterium]
MNSSKSLRNWLGTTLLLSLLFSTLALAGPRQEATLLNAVEVMNELHAAPDQNIPKWLLDRAYAVIVVPNVLKVSVVLGGRRGTGVMVIRKDDGTWSNPVFVNLTGGSVGFQVGVQSTDVMLVFTSRQGVEGIIGGKVTLGADASVAAGPVGRQTEAATDIGMNAQVYAYSRSKGLFAGVSLDGSALTINRKYNAEYYNKPGILASEILAPNGPKPTATAQQFIASLDEGPIASTPGTANTTSTSTSTPASASSSSSSSVDMNKANGLVAYPMEDSHPGAEPPK